MGESGAIETSASPARPALTYAHVDPDEFEFRSTSRNECDNFIHYVKHRAFKEGKSRDNAWMADLAGLYFYGDALVWYEGLDDSVQQDWEKLKAELIMEYGQKENK